MMTSYESAAYCAELINNVFHTTIEQALKNKFGIETTIEATSNKDYVLIKDTLKTDVDKKMRSNKIQRALFDSIYMEGQAWYYEDTKQLGCRFNLYYIHPNNGGSNGHHIGTILIVDTFKNTYTWTKY